MLQTNLFDATPTDEKVYIYQLSNRTGLHIELINFGAAIKSVRWPDGTEVNLGFETLAEYLINEPSLGVTVGRVINRIAGGEFELDEKRHQLACNENSINHLHGGTRGLSKVVWQGERCQRGGFEGVLFSYHSPHGDQGYPGAVDITAFYGLNESNELKIEFSATTDAATPLNLSNHAYWNLAGVGRDTILNHELTINADFYLPTNTFNIPTGEILKVAQTPLDFRAPKLIGQHIQEMGLGYDHCYVLKKPAGALGLAAHLRDPKSQRSMEVWTTQPGVQLYTAHYLKDLPIAGGMVAQPFSGICLETQHFSDAVHHPHFPSIILRPGQKYHEVTVCKFHHC